MVSENAKEVILEDDVRVALKHVLREGYIFARVWKEVAREEEERVRKLEEDRKNATRKLLKEARRK